jgi:acyl transferase domain-containing protein/acyl carrier protein
MDPQQRLLLEVAWEALENAGEAPDKLCDSRTGVFVGMCKSDYLLLQVKENDPELFDVHYASGNAHSVVSGRLSYLLGLRGPSVTLDTACSSSLVAVHLACQSLRLGECDMAIAGGVNLVLSPENTIAFDKAGMLASSGRCKTFDASADGFVQGEGCGVIVLRRLSSAFACGSRIAGVIRGTAVNQDGASSGLTAPNGPAQVSVIREALRNAGLESSRVGYVEAHGTATTLGDPIEVRALGEALGNGRSKADPLRIGSVKTNIGHLEAAAGIAGLIKVVLALQHREIPPHLHFKKPNPFIAWDELPIAVSAEPTPWRPAGGSCVAGVSSFGFSGTNAHAVLEEAPSVTPSRNAATGRSLHLFTLSAKDRISLERLSRRFQEHLEAHPAEALPDICYTANAGRAHFAHRLAACVDTPRELAAKLEAFVHGENASYRKVAFEDRPKIAFYFTGAGAGYAGTGRTPFDAELVFREAIEACGGIVRPGVGCTPSESLGPAEPRLFAFEYAISELLRSWGIVPSALAGEGVGQYAAACAAGVFGPADALGLIRRSNRGDPRGFDERLVRCAAPKIRLLSNVSGEPVGESDAASPAYWLGLPREPVRLHASMQALYRLGCRIFVEIGPYPRLISAAAECPAEEDARVYSLSPEGDDRQLPHTLSALYLAGAEIDWPAFYKGRDCRRLALPTYPFRRERCWIRQRGAVWDRGETGHPLLGRLLRTPLKERFFATLLDARSLPFLEDHVVQRLTVFPAAAYLEMAAAAAKRLFGSECVALEDLEIREALILPKEGKRTVGLVVGEERENAVEFRVFSLDAEKEESGWKLHAAGFLRIDPERRPDRAEIEPVPAVKARCTEAVDIARFYRNLQERGIELGPSFRGIENLRRREGEAIAEVRLPPAARTETGRYRIHPALLDACIQAVAAAAPIGGDLYMPVGIGRFRLEREAFDPLFSHARIEASGGNGRGSITAHVRIFDGAGNTIARVSDLRLERIDPGGLLRVSGENIDAWLYKTAWHPADLYLLSTSEIAERTSKHLPVLCAGNGIRNGGSPDRDLDLLCAAYIVDAFRRLGFDFSAEKPADENALARKMNVTGRHRRLFGRFLNILKEEGILAEVRGEWKALKRPGRIDTNALCERLRAEHGDRGAELGLLQRCGGALAALLRGEADPLQILFPGGDTGEASRIYRETPVAAAFNGIVREAVRAAIEQLPETSDIRILEIGAGTGGTTAHVLPALPAGRTEYVFTDIGKSFLAQAKSMFSGFGFITYRALDIERDPAGQGFTNGDFDIVIASNVFHATAELDRTLAHARRLIAPGGVLLILEAVRAQRWFDLTFGFTEGWWKFTDLGKRGDSPLLNRSEWLDLLAETGFESVRAIPSTPPGAGMLADNAVMVARAPRIKENAGRGVQKRPAGTWLIFADGGGLGENLAERLKAAGDAALLVFSGPAFEIVDAERIILNPEAPDAFGRLFPDGDREPYAGVIHLWGLDEEGVSDTDADRLMEGERSGCGSLLHAIQAAVASGETPRFWAVTRGVRPVADHPVVSVPVQATIWGLAKTVSIEHPELQLACIDLSPVPESDEAGSLLSEIGANRNETEIAYRDGHRYTARLVRAPAGAGRGAVSDPPPRSMRLEIAVPGTTGGVGLQAVGRRPPGEGEVEIRVHATGLNFRDVLNLLGMRRDPEPIGGECSGTVVAVGRGVENIRAGDPVVAVTQGGFARFVTTGADLVVPKPENASFEQAASLPLAYLTAHYALHRLGKMRRGERILIHSAAGGVGMAAVRLSMQSGAEIFATAGSRKKRAFLAALGVRHVADSRTLDFAREVSAQTGGEGVDIVLNGLTGEFLSKSLALLRAGGRFLELGKTGIPDGRPPEAGPDVFYIPVDLAEKLLHDPKSVRPILLDLMRRVGEGDLPLLPITVFPFEKASEAFRFMARAKHIGKVVVSQSDVEDLPVNRFTLPFRSDATYLVTGGLSGLGLRAAEWMVGNGARNLVLIGRRPPAGEARARIAALRDWGVEITIVEGDVSDEKVVRAALTRISESGRPLRGILHCAGALEDGMLRTQSWPRFEAVMAPKVKGAWILHTLTKNIPLDVFVFFSSIASVFGSAGQGNHAAANAFLDALAHFRKANGLPALSINWGAWSEIGAAAAHGVGKRIERQGVGVISPDAGLRVLARAMERSAVQVSVSPVNWPKFLRAFGSEGPPPFYRAMARETRRSGETGMRPAPATSARSDSGPASQDLLSAAPPKKRRSLLLAHIRAAAERALGLASSAEIDPRRPLSEIGLDSLMAVEMRNTLGTSLNLRLPATLIFDYPTIEGIADFISRGNPLLSGMESPTPPVAAPDMPVDLIGAVQGLSDGEIERMLSDQPGSLPSENVRKTIA